MECQKRKLFYAGDGIREDFAEEVGIRTMCYVGNTYGWEYIYGWEF